MDRKLFGFLSGWQFTVLASVAIIAPTALYAVTTTAVSITDPGTGAKSLIDGGRRLWVYDSVAGYANNPANYVRIFVSCLNNSSTIYSPPSGKAFVLKSIHYSFEGGEQNNENFYYFRVAAGFIAGFDDMNSIGTSNADFGNGFYIKNGETISQQCSSASFVGTLVGYLVPANAVPASAEEAGQSIRVGPSVGLPGRHR